MIFEDKQDRGTCREVKIRVTESKSETKITDGVAEETEIKRSKRRKTRLKVFRTKINKETWRTIIGSRRKIENLICIEESTVIMEIYRNT